MHRILLGNRAVGGSCYGDGGILRRLMSVKQCECKLEWSSVRLLSVLSLRSALFSAGQIKILNINVKHLWTVYRTANTSQVVTRGQRCTA